MKCFLCLRSFFTGCLVRRELAMGSKQLTVCFLAKRYHLHQEHIISCCIYQICCTLNYIHQEYCPSISNDDTPASNSKILPHTTALASRKASFKQFISLDPTFPPFLPPSLLPPSPSKNNMLPQVTHPFNSWDHYWWVGGHYEDNHTPVIIIIMATHPSICEVVK